MPSQANLRDLYAKQGKATRIYPRGHAELCEASPSCAKLLNSAKLRKVTRTYANLRTATQIHAKLREMYSYTLS